MERATIVNYEFIPSETVTAQGKRREIKSRYPGYKIQEERNGYWVLIKKAKFEVTLCWNDGIETFNMRSDILELYGRQRATEKLLKTFVKDVEDGKYKIFMDGHSYTIM